MRYLVEHGRTGLLSPPGDALALAQSVIRLLRDSELSEYLAGNARQVFQSYSWPIVREQWLGVYRSLVSREVATVEELAPAGVDQPEH